MTTALITAISECFGCTSALAGTIAAKCQPLNSDPGDTIYPYRTDFDRSCVMIAGEAREMAYGRNGQSLLLHHVKPHDLFGAIFSDETGAAPAQVTAILPTSTAQIKSSTMIQLIECYPNVAVGITRQLVRRLDETRRRVVEETMLSAAGRVCAELSRRSAATSDNIVRPMPVFADLAITVNSTRETVSRTVSKLEARGIVRRVANGLQIVALHRLDEMAV